MRQASTVLRFRSPGRGLLEITGELRAWCAETGVRAGLLSLFCRHTSASLLIQENAAPEVRADLERFFDEIAPEDGRWTHDEEGPDDMPSHARTALGAVSLVIPVRDGNLALGTWQGVFLFEHRRAGRSREIVLTLQGD